MTEFVLKSKYFEFNLQIKHQISVAAIATKFSPFFSIFSWVRKKLNFCKRVVFRYIDNSCILTIISLFGPTV